MENIRPGIAQRKGGNPHCESDIGGIGCQRLDRRDLLLKGANQNVQKG